MFTDAVVRSSREPGGRLSKAALRLLFPTRCLACRAQPVDELFSGGVCRGCWRSIPSLPAGRCVVCDEPLPAAWEFEDAFVPEGGYSSAPARAWTCGRCVLEPPPFRVLRGAAPYRARARALLLAFKFQGAGFLADHLARCMTREIGSEDRLAAHFDEIVPVPATAWSRCLRDHPADLLAAAVARRLDLPLNLRRLRKTRRTQRQSALPGRLRFSNVRGAFVASPGAPRRILLVDDVATSGATARECARALLAAGARSVDVWCFARATRDDEHASELEVWAREAPQAPLPPSARAASAPEARP
jgi:ComF family protein